jgi:hypothetical protein
MSTLHLRPASIALKLLLIVFALDLAYALTQALHFGFDHLDKYPIRLFDLDWEQSVPTLFSTLLLLSIALVLLFIASEQRSRRQPAVAWRMLALVFLFLAADEGLEVHEAVSRLITRFFHPTGILFFAWVIPYGILTVLLGTLFFRFLLSLPARTRRLFILAATLYLGGALGMELLGAKLASTLGDDNPTYALIAGIEENLEMLGAILFLYALLRFAQAGRMSLVIVPELTQPASSTAPAAPTILDQFPPPSLPQTMSPAQ